MRKTVVLVIGLWAILAFLWLLIGKIHQLLDEQDRLNNNVAALMVENKKIQLDSVTMATESAALQLTISELKQYREEDCELIKKLKIKNRQLESISKQNVSVEAKFETIVTDTVIIRDSVPVIAQNIRFKDPFIEIEASVLSNKLNGSIKLKATLKQVLYHEYRRKFLFIRWGRGKVKQVIVCDNPYVNIDYQEHIEIQKR